MRWKLFCSLLVLGMWGCVADPEPEKPVDPETETSSQETSPDSGEVLRVEFVTTQGNFTVEVYESWAPEGAKQFQRLVESGFFKDVRFFRVVDGFMAQFGINGDPAVHKKFDQNIPPDRPRKSNVRGMLTFAMAGSPDTRSTQLFINTVDNTFLDDQGFAPIGKVVEGINVVDELNAEYGDAPPSGIGPDQGRIQSEGNAYLIKEYPNLDYIKEATIIGFRPEGESPSTVEEAGESSPPGETPDTETKPE